MRRAKHQNGMAPPMALSSLGHKALTIADAWGGIMRHVPAFRALGAVLICAGLAACGAEAPRTRGGEEGPVHDPVMSAALEGQLMVDPDLSQANNRNLAVVPAGPADPSLPLPDPKN
jgi:hypothetical protein